MSTRDTQKRPLRSLRLSVTDRCNLRCSYCMPEEDYTWLPHDNVLSFEEIGDLVDVFSGLGVDRLRITGGEPLLRRDLDQLIGRLAAKPAIRDLALTTNGVLLAQQAAALHSAGLQRITVSLDTLDPETFRMLTRRDQLDRVLDGIRTAAGLWGGLKIDTVAIRSVNDDQLGELIAFGRTVNAEVRFIEYMDVGGATRWSMDRVVPRDEMLTLIGRRFGTPTALPRTDAAPADRYRLPDGTTFGIIASTTQPFCATCDRSRVTADGRWFTCLYARSGVDLMGPLRAASAGPRRVREIVEQAWQGRTDQGAVDRLRLRERGALAPREELRRDPHLEMHTRGG